MATNQKKKLIQITRAVQAVIDASWIPQSLRGKATFFGQEDLWIFIPHWDVKLCEECAEFAAGVPFIPGRQLRGTFPYLEIQDADTIAANVHPNCRCELVREGTEEPKEVLSKEEAKQAFIKGEIE